MIESDSPSIERRAPGGVTVQVVSVVFCGVSTYIHGVPLTDRHHHDPRGCPYVCGALKLSVRNHGPNDIGIHNKFRENVSFRVTIESPSEHVYTVLWCDEDSRVLVVMAADVCYNGVKVYDVSLRQFCFMCRYVCRKCNVILG